MVKNNSRLAPVLAILTLVSLMLSTCASQPTIAPLSTPTRRPSVTPTPTIIPVPLPAFSLEPGQFYFSQDGQPGMFYSRNVAAYFEKDYGTLLDWSVAGGTRVVRFGLVNNLAFGGYPYTNTGELNEEVVRNFESLLDDAEAHGIYVLMWFTGWGDWNTTGQTDWASNPFNAAVGGPAQNPTEVFQASMPANIMWFEFVNRLVKRWQGRDNILAWELVGEINLIQGITEQQGIAFAEKMAEVIRAADSQHRPITASLGDVGTWWNFYDSDAIDFIQIHPYQPDNQLDRDIVEEIHQHLTRYNKPVLIGESGLNFEPLDDDWITSSPQAHIGMEHAVWAGVVSGAMNARALFWEDAYGIYFPELRSGWLNQYAELELPTARFTRGVDFTDFKPLTVLYPGGAKIWGASVGNDHLALGWFRDAGSEPPDWTLLPLISGQSVMLEVPGSVKDWQVDFYDTKTGYTLGGSTLLSRQGDHVTVTLPDFTDDIAFKLFVNDVGAIVPPPTPAPEPTAIALSSSNPVAGEWVGTIFGEGSDFAAVLNVTIQPDCQVGDTCGKSATEWCSIDLVLTEIDGDTLVFLEQDMTGTSTCPAGGIDHLRLQPDGTILLRYEADTSGGGASTGILHRP
jgi:hypothetical protein